MNGTMVHVNTDRAQALRFRLQSREDPQACHHRRRSSNTLSMKVRLATGQDVPSIISAYRTSWRAGYAGLLNESEIERQADRRSDYDWHHAIRQADRLVLVAEEGAVVLGVVECEHNPKIGRVPLTGSP
jgi:hypothetical protein